MAAPPNPAQNILCVESGTTPVRDGTHNLSPLAKGKRYEVVMACAGTGTIDVTIAPMPAQTQSSDDNPATYRIRSAPVELTFIIRGGPGASGAAAWQINEER